MTRPVEAVFRRTERSGRAFRKLDDADSIRPQAHAALRTLLPRCNDASDTNEGAATDDNAQLESVALVAGGASVHFLQKLAHRIELRAEALPISGLQSLHCLIVAIKRLPCLTCRRAGGGPLLCCG